MIDTATIAQWLAALDVARWNNMDWTAASAISTAAMAAMTFWTIRQARKHHRDEYRPILSLVPLEAIDPVDRNGLLVAEQAHPQNSDRFYLLRGALKNVGRGPALNVKATLRFLRVEGYGFSTELAPVGAGERLGSAVEPLRVAARFHDRFNDMDFQMGAGGEWEILIEYNDVFLRRFHTVHSKIQQKPWTVLGCGDAPTGRSRRRWSDCFGRGKPDR